MKINFANQNNCRTFAVDFTRKSTERYADFAPENVRNFQMIRKDEYDGFTCISVGCLLFSRIKVFFLTTLRQGGGVQCHASYMI